MLTVCNVTKKYGKFVANNDVSLTVEAGQTTILIGPNGAGKTTLIKCIAGLLRFEGKIEICNWDNKSIEAKKVFGYVPEIPAVYDLLTVAEHIEFIARAYQLKEYEEYAEELLECFELTDKKDKLGRELSKGMQQKLSIICALLPKPSVVVFDEPMVGLDPHAIKELKKIFVTLKKAGVSVLISTHMLDSIKELWDKAYIMMDGKIAASKEKKNKSKDTLSLEELFFNITENNKTLPEDAFVQRDIDVQRDIENEK
jgi:ABC-type multidrug transport system ATPase subunit